MNVALFGWITSAFDDLAIINYSDTPTVHREANVRYDVWKKFALDAGPFSTEFYEAPPLGWLWPPALSSDTVRAPATLKRC
jgi:hypothetical protein